MNKFQIRGHTKISDICLLLTVVALIFTLVFPPFYLPLMEGLSTNLGFGFLFFPPKSGALVGLVNVPLLAIELFVLTMIGAIAWYWAVQGGDEFFEELSVAHRAMSLQEKRDVVAALNISKNAGKAITPEILAKHGFNVKQINYVEIYQRINSI